MDAFLASPLVWLFWIVLIGFLLLVAGIAWLHRSGAGLEAAALGFLLYSGAAVAGFVLFVIGLLRVLT